MACIVEGCKKTAIYNIGIRLRRPKGKATARPSGTAIWSPETGAKVCAEHATKGFHITIVIVPNKTGMISMETSSPPGNPIRRVKAIKHEAEE
jgi:hypothetical protein